MHTYLTHTDWPAFLAAIRTTPDDDLPRLVAVDWLDEIGCGERAELIRVGCELAKEISRMKHAYRPLTNKEALARMETEDRGERFPRPDGKEEAKFQMRVLELVEQLFPTARRASGGRVGDVRFDRGFIVGVKSSFDWWASRADVICAEGVGLTVRLTSTPPTGFNVLRSRSRAKVWSMNGRHGLSSHEMFTRAEILKATRSVVMNHFYSNDCRYAEIGLALSALTWPTVAKWEVAYGHDDFGMDGICTCCSQSTFTPPTLAAPDTSPSP